MSQNIKQQFCISCLRKEEAAWLGINQQPVNAGSRRIGVKTAKPSLSTCTQQTTSLMCTERALPCHTRNRFML